MYKVFVFKYIPKWTARIIIIIIIIITVIIILLLYTYLHFIHFSFHRGNR